jgi:hypothetical protein
MAGNILAELSVLIATEGQADAEATLDKVKEKIDAVSAANKKAEAASRGFTKGMTTGISGLASKVANLARSFSLGTPGGLGGVMSVGGIAAGALSGTVEAERLGRALEYFARTLGDELGPAVRAVTDYIIQAADWYAKLDKSTRKAIMGVALFATGLALAATVLPSIIAGVAALFSPAGAIVAGIAAVVAVIASIPDVIGKIEAAVAKLAGVAGNNKGGWKAAEWLDFPKGILAEMGRVFGFKPPDALMPANQKKIADANAKDNDKKNDGLNRRFPAGFETGQQTWMRLMQTFAEGEAGFDTPQEVAKKQLEEGKKSNVQLGNINAMLAAMNMRLDRLKPVQ